MHLAIGKPYAGPAFVCGVGEPAGRVDVVAQPGPSSVEHTPWRIDCPDNLDARYVLRYVHGVTGLENHVVPRRRVAQRVGEIDVDPTRSVHLPVKADAVGVRLRRQ